MTSLSLCYPTQSLLTEFTEALNKPKKDSIRAFKRSNLAVTNMKLFE